MLDEATREAILRLHEKGYATRRIARQLAISRSAAKSVLASGSSLVPSVARGSLCGPHRQQIVDLFAACNGNLVRVHEELLATGVNLSYQALTGYCRRESIGKAPAKPVGRYSFSPGEEQQHDTSPHDVIIGGRKRRAQTASVVLCYSHMLYFQLYPRFRRFECKVFLNEAAGYFEGSCGRWMIDNTHVVVLSGTGKDMVPVPEMAAFAKRFGAVFAAHEKGDANRSARVERPFHYIENNFLAGRQFTDWEQLNREARAWCDKVNAATKRHLHASPRQLFVSERAHLVPLPAYVPEVYQIHERIVDCEGYINVDTNRYSAPWKLIGRRLEVRETKTRLDFHDGPRRVAQHERVVDATSAKVTLPEHRPPRSEKVFAKSAPSPEERQLELGGQEVVEYVALLKQRGRSLHTLRRLAAMLQDYPREALFSAIRTATHYGLDDLERLERLVLRQIAGEFFQLPDSTGAEAPRQTEDTDDTARNGEAKDTEHDDDRRD